MNRRYVLDSVQKTWKTATAPRKELLGRRILRRLLIVQENLAS